MPEETSIKDLDPRLQKQLDTAEKAIGKGNAAYAVDVCAGVLKRHPECLEVRQLLRRAQFHLAGSKTKGVGRFLSKVTSAPFMMKADKLVEKDPKEAMEQAERLINGNPGNIAAHKLLGQAATKAGLVGTAVFAYESAAEVEPENVEVALLHADALIAAKRGKEAILIGDRLLKKNPALAEAQELVRRASVAVSMEKGKWEGDASFRDNLADQEEAVRLEQAARVANDEDTLQALIKDLKKKIEEQPENINHYRDIARHYRTLGQFDQALEWVEQARKQPTGQADSTLERLQSELRGKANQARIEEVEKRLEADPDNQQLLAELEQMKTADKELRMQNAAEMVERYPNDYAARYEYGQLLYEAGDHDLAIQQFQLSQRNPKVRLKSLLFLGRTYKAKKFYDLAVDQLESAKKEIPQMDDLKKSIVYELAEAYEGMGAEDKAIEEYKIIYANDIGYLDVAEKINHFYQNR